MNRLFETDRDELKKFGKTLIIAGPIIGSLAIGFGFWQQIPFPRYAGATLVVLGLYGLATTFTAPILLFPVYVLFTAIGNTVQWTLNLLVLSFAYYVLLTPIALYFRIVGRDPLKTKLDPAAESYWEAQEPRDDATRQYSKQY